MSDATGGKYHGPDTSMVQVRSVPLNSPEKILIFFASLHRSQSFSKSRQAERSGEISKLVFS
jgi:hypothetical protein